MSGTSRSVRPRAALTALAATVIAVAYFSYLNRAYELDDALIYYRYFRNFLAGNGLVYNVGERFNALTSPLHVYLSLAISGLCGSIRSPMIVMSGLLTATTAIGLFVLYGRHESRWPFVAFGAGLIAVSRYFYSVYGMETPLFLTLCVACLILYERRRTAALGVAGALLVLTRGEGALLLAALGAVHLDRRRRLPPMRHAVAPVLILAGNAAFNLAYYGALLPHTLMAKIQQGRSGMWGERWLFFNVGGQLEYFAGSKALFAASAALAMLGAYRLGRRDVNVAVGGFLALLTGFYLGLNVPNYHWYYAPYYAFGCMYVGLGFAELYDRAGTLRAPFAARAGRLVAGLAAVSMLGVHAYATATRPVSDEPRQRLYPMIGAWLERNTPRDATVAMVEVGIIGYYSDRRVVDILGLVTPENAQSLGDRRLDVWLLHDDPDFILVHDPLWPLELSIVDAVRQGRYRLSETFAFPSVALFERHPARSRRD